MDEGRESRNRDGCSGSHGTAGGLLVYGFSYPESGRFTRSQNTVRIKVVQEVINKAFQQEN